MARRRKQSLTDDLIDSLSQVPWYIGPIFAILLYVTLPIVFHVLGFVGKSKVPGMYSAFFGSIMWLAPALVLFAWVIAEITKLFRRIDSWQPNPRKPVSAPPAPPDQHQQPSPPPSCPIARKGPKAETQFWGCSTYPSCKGTVNIDA
jgi:hypothetical protein